DMNTIFISSEDNTWTMKLLFQTSCYNSNHALMPMLFKHDQCSRQFSCIPLNFIQLKQSFLLDFTFHLTAFDIELIELFSQWIGRCQIRSQQTFDANIHGFHASSSVNP